MTDSTPSAPNVYMVRADFARYAPAFLKGNYVGIGWLEDVDLRGISSREELRLLYEDRYPVAAPMNTAQNVGQIWRFVHDLSIGTYVATPWSDNSRLLVGKITGNYAYVPDPSDSPYPHRKSVKWFSERITRSALSIPTQNTIRSSLTIFQISQYDEILQPFGVGLPERTKRVLMTEEEIKRSILDELLELRFDEFEILVTELLAALGFDAEHVGKTGDGGIDVTGKLRVYDFATIDIMVQVKQYKTGSIDHKTIQNFRIKVPDRIQAAFVTTSSFTKKAREEAEKDGFKKIGLIDGSRLVDILIENYDHLSEEVREKLNLRKTLIPK